MTKCTSPCKHLPVEGYSFLNLVIIVKLVRLVTAFEQVIDITYALRDIYDQENTLVYVVILIHIYFI